MKYFEIYAWSDCPYCFQAASLLRMKKQQYAFTTLDKSRDLLEHFKTKYNWKTVPIIVMKDTETNEETFIGGFTDLQQYFKELRIGEGNCESDGLG